LIEDNYLSICCTYLKIYLINLFLDKLNNNKNNSDRHIILKELFIQEKNIENNDTKSLISTNAKILYYLPLLKEINEMYLTHGKGLLIYFIVEIICLKYQFVNFILNLNYLKN